MPQQKGCPTHCLAAWHGSGAPLRGIWVEAMDEASLAQLQAPRLLQKWPKRWRQSLEKKRRIDSQRHQKWFESQTCLNPRRQKRNFDSGRIGNLASRAGWPMPNQTTRLTSRSLRWQRAPWTLWRWQWPNMKGQRNFTRSWLGSCTIGQWRYFEVLKDAMVWRCGGSWSCRCSPTPVQGQ